MVQEPHIVRHCTTMFKVCEIAYKSAQNHTSILAYKKNIPSVPWKAMKRKKKQGSATRKCWTCLPYMAPLCQYKQHSIRMDSKNRVSPDWLDICVYLVIRSVLFPSLLLRAVM